MPQPVLTAEVIVAAINAAPGKTISHADLVAQLTTEGYRGIGRTLIDLKRAGEFVGKTDWNGTDKPVLMYSLNP